MSNRSYSAVPNDGHTSATLEYIYDSSHVYSGVGGQLQTGAWRPRTVADLSSNNISVSGLNLSVTAVAITGNPQVQVSNFPAITPVSGLMSLSPSTSMNVAVTGGMITGQLAGTVTVNSVAITGSPVVTSKVQGGTGYSGVTYGSYTGVTNAYNGLVFSYDPNRITFFIQNINTGIPAYIGLGAPISSATSLILNPSYSIGSAGGSFSSDQWKGNVYVSGAGMICWAIS